VGWRVAANRADRGRTFPLMKAPLQVGSPVIDILNADAQANRGIVHTVLLSSKRQAVIGNEGPVTIVQGDLPYRCTSHDAT
jgi:hypothetical protein